MFTLDKTKAQAGTVIVKPKSTITEIIMKEILTMKNKSQIVHI